MNLVDLRTVTKVMKQDLCFTGILLRTWSRHDTENSVLCAMEFMMLHVRRQSRDTQAPIVLFNGNLRLQYSLDTRHNESRRQ